MKTWKDKLTTAQAAFMQDIVDQVPEAMNARSVFVDVLNRLAGIDPPAPGAQGETFRFVIARTDSEDMQGTNDEARARLAADNESNYVYDTEKGVWLMNSDADDDSTLTEAK